MIALALTAAVFVGVAYVVLALLGPVRPDERPPVPGVYGPDQHSRERQAGKLSSGDHGGFND